jgi:predicted secreted Zn-dependent protease
MSLHVPTANDHGSFGSFLSRIFRIYRVRLKAEIASCSFAVIGASFAGICMKAGGRLCLLATCLASLPMVAHAEWQAVEKVKTYAVAGISGAELYESIGERGPGVGSKVRAIAYTGFKLTWTKKYEPQGGACVLVSAQPKLTITYTLPKPAEQLPASTRRSWETFIAGVHKHELVHGEMIKDMVKEIETASVGLSASDDPDCRKIRADLTTRLSEISNKQRQRARDFDKTELSDGGNLQQLVLGLVREQ